jgi:hypothetical protein
MHACAPQRMKATAKAAKGLSLYFSAFFASLRLFSGQGDPSLNHHKWTYTPRRCKPAFS